MILFTPFGADLTIAAMTALTVDRSLVNLDMAHGDQWLAYVMVSRAAVCV